MNQMLRIHHTVIAAALMAAACKGTPSATPAAAAAPPGVAVITATPERVEVTGEWLATLDGNVNAQIRPQVSGYLVRRDYREGAVVRKGEVLFDIDRRPFESALAQARAHLAEGRAQLAKADRDIARDRPLAEQRAIAQSQLDNDLSAHDAAQAAVESAQAAVDAAQLNLGFTRVTSLIDGVAAIATAQIGDLVGPTSLLTTVSQLDPIKAYFRSANRSTSASRVSSEDPAGPRGSGKRQADSRWCWPTGAPIRSEGQCSRSIARSIRRWARFVSARSSRIRATCCARARARASERRRRCDPTPCSCRNARSQEDRKSVV